MIISNEVMIFTLDDIIALISELLILTELFVKDGFYVLSVTLHMHYIYHKTYFPHSP